MIAVPYPQELLCTFYIVQKSIENRILFSELPRNAAHGTCRFCEMHRYLHVSRDFPVIYRCIYMNIINMFHNVYT